MAFDITIIIVFWHQEPCPYKMANLINKWMTSDSSINQPFPSFSLSSGLPIPWDSNVEIILLVTLQWL